MLGGPGIPGPGEPVQNLLGRIAAAGGAQRRGLADGAAHRLAVGHWLHQRQQQTAGTLAAVCPEIVQQQVGAPGQCATQLAEVDVVLAAEDPVAATLLLLPQESQQVAHQRQHAGLADGFVDDLARQGVVAPGQTRQACGTPHHVAKAGGCDGRQQVAAHRFVVEQGLQPR